MVEMYSKIQNALSVKFEENRVQLFLQVILKQRIQMRIIEIGILVNPKGAQTNLTDLLQSILGKIFNEDLLKMKIYLQGKEIMKISLSGINDEEERRFLVICEVKRL